MTRLIDGDALIELINGGYDLDFDEVPETKRELLRMIMEQPTVDAVPVIKCKDCKWQMSEWLAINHKPFLNHYCSYHDYTDDLGYDDDFCSKAERKEDDQID